MAVTDGSVAIAAKQMVLPPLLGWRWWGEEKQERVGWWGAVEG